MQTIVPMGHLENIIRKGSEIEEKSSLNSSNSITCRLLTVTQNKSEPENIDIIDVSENQSQKNYSFSFVHSSTIIKPPLYVRHYSKCYSQGDNFFYTHSLWNLLTDREIQQPFVPLFL